MRYIIEFELPDNDTVKERIETAYVTWHVWGYSGYAKPKPQENDEYQFQKKIKKLLDRRKKI